MALKIQAAGGLVRNCEGALLLIYRRGFWDLPKGKLDPGETPEAAALREVEEETGLVNLVRGQLVGTTLHSYAENGQEVLKETFWYRMRINDLQTGHPQTEEDILEIRWVVNDELDKYLEQTYPNIRDIITRERDLPLSD